MVQSANMKQRLLYPVLILTLLTVYSCKSNQAGFGDQEVYAAVSDEYIDMELTYVGTTFDYHIMECYIVNKYSTPITLDRFNFELINEKKNIKDSPLSPEEAIALLETQQDRLKKQKKASVIAGIFAVGLGVASNATLGGSVANNVAYSVESALYIADDNRFFNRNIKSIDDEMIYIDDYVLDMMTVPAGAKVSADVIFAIHKMRGNVDILYSGPDNDYIFEFKASDFASR